MEGIDGNVWLLITPILLLQLGLLIYNGFNLFRKDRTRFMSKPIWVVIILLGGLIGNIVYLFLEGIGNDSKRN